MFLDAREQAAQTFTGQQHQLVAFSGAELAQPLQHGLRIRRGTNRDQRRAQHARAAPLEECNEQIEFAHLGQSDQPAL